MGEKKGELEIASKTLLRRGQEFESAVILQNPNHKSILSRLHQRLSLALHGWPESWASSSTTSRLVLNFLIFFVHFSYNSLHWPPTVGLSHATASYSSYPTTTRSRLLFPFLTFLKNFFFMMTWIHSICTWNRHTGTFDKHTSPLACSGLWIERSVTLATDRLIIDVHWSSQSIPSSHRVLLPSTGCRRVT